MTHSEKAALRGEPSYVWRSGQERRLQMVKEWIRPNGITLDFGCGLGVYSNRFKQLGCTTIGFDVEEDRLVEAIPQTDGVNLAIGEHLPYPNCRFDTVFSNEVIEHVTDDYAVAQEMVRITKMGGHIIIFCPNRWYPVEQHGIYWRGEYHFGNIPLVNYLPNRWRNQLAPHVRTYTKAGLLDLFAKMSVRVVHYERVFGGYDNIEYRFPKFGRNLKSFLYKLEKTGLNVFGISHLLVLEKV